MNSRRVSYGIVTFLNQLESKTPRRSRYFECFFDLQSRDATRGLFTAAIFASVNRFIRLMKFAQRD